jgi:hypothetical protein
MWNPDLWLDLPIMRSDMLTFKTKMAANWQPFLFSFNFFI